MSRAKSTESTLIPLPNFHPQPNRVRNCKWNLFEACQFIRLLIYIYTVSGKVHLKNNHKKLRDTAATYFIGTPLLTCFFICSDHRVLSKHRIPVRRKIENIIHILNKLRQTPKSSVKTIATSEYIHITYLVQHSTNFLFTDPKTCNLSVYMHITRINFRNKNKYQEKEKHTLRCNQPGASQDTNPICSQSPTHTKQKRLRFLDKEINQNKRTWDKFWGQIAWLPSHKWSNELG